MSKEYVKKIDLRLEMKFKSEFRIIGFCLDNKAELFFKHIHKYTFKNCGLYILNQFYIFEKANYFLLILHQFWSILPTA